MVDGQPAGDRQGGIDIRCTDQELGHIGQFVRDRHGREVRLISLHGGAPPARAGFWRMATVKTRSS